MSELTTKRPVAFRVQRPPESAIDGHEWRLFNEESEARAEADAKGCDYQGLYVKDGEPTSDCPICGYDIGSCQDCAKAPPEWLWWGKVDDKDVVTFGRWPKRGARWRYKLAEIQPTEHDPAALSAQPQPEAVEAVAWRVRNDFGHWYSTMDRSLAETWRDTEHLEVQPLYTAPPLAPDARMRRALERIAAFNDTHANEHLAKTGSYTNFDEPSAVKIAREALSGAADLSNTSTEARLRLGSMVAQWTYDPEAEAYYFAPMQAAAGPYLKQRHVDAIIDFAADGTLAGVELIDNMPPPPLQALSCAADASNASAEARLHKRMHIVEGIILRRIYQNRIDGYTIETAKEIVEALSSAGADDGKEPEGCVEGHAQCLTIDRQSSIGFGSCRSSVEAGIKPGPSDPTPPDATAQRDAIARIKVALSKGQRLVMSDAFRVILPRKDRDALLSILALQTRVGG